MVPDSHQRAKGHEQVGHDDDEMPDVLVVHQHVDDKGEQGEEDVVRQLESKKNAPVQGELEIVVALQHLDEQPCPHHQRLHRDERQAQSHELAECGHPIRDRRGVGNLVQARLSLAPHQLAGKKDDEQRNHQRHHFLRIGQAVRQEPDRARRRRNERHAHVFDLRSAGDDERRRHHGESHGAPTRHDRLE